jgi:hypothetical protein
MGDTAEQVRVVVLPDGRVDRPNGAAFLGREPKTLAEWRSKGIGPRCFLVGGRVFYWWNELQALARGKKWLRKPCGLQRLGRPSPRSRKAALWGGDLSQFTSTTAVTNITQPISGFKP